MQKLPERNDATCHRIVLDVVKCVQERIIEELNKKGEVKFGNFAKSGVSCNAVLEKGKKSGLVIDSSMFAAWRNPEAVSSSQPLMSQFGQSVLGKRGTPERSNRASKSVMEVNSDGEEVGSSSSE